MSAKIEKLENNTVTLEFIISAEEFEAANQKAYKKNVGKLKIPGFRPGKAPRQIVEKMFGEGIFYEDAINIALPSAYDKAVEETGISPVDRPEIDVKDLSKENGITIVAKVTVKPEFELAEYKGVSVPKIEYNVTDEDINNELNKVKERNGRSITIEDRAVIADDIVNIDFEGFVDGVPFDGGKGEGHDLTIGSGQFIPGFEEQLTGKNTGDETEVNVTFPEDYHAEDLKGKAAVFKVKINSIRATEYPELDDEFAKDVSEFDTLDEYKEDIRKKLTQDKENQAKQELENKILETITNATEINIPEVMIETQIDNLVRDFEMQMKYQGMNLEMYMQYTGTTMEQMREQFKERALTQVKTSLVIEAVAKKEGIKPNEDEISKEYEKLSEQYKMDTDKLKKYIHEHDVVDSLTSSKTVQFLVDNAVLTEKTKPAKKPATSKSKKVD